MNFIVASVCIFQCSFTNLLVVGSVSLSGLRCFLFSPSLATSSEPRRSQKEKQKKVATLVKEKTLRVHANIQKEVLLEKNVIESE